MATNYTGYLGGGDVKWWDGITRIFSRRTSTGGTIDLNMIGYSVDVLEVYGGGTDYSATAINSAISAIGTTRKVSIVLQPGTWTIGANVTVPSNITLVAPSGAMITKAATSTFTVNGLFEAGLYQVFSGFDSGDVTFGAGSVKEVHPEWWYTSGDYAAAIAAAAGAHNRVAFVGNGKTYSVTNSVAVPDKAIAFVGYGNPIIDVASTNPAFVRTHHKMLEVRGIAFTGGDYAISYSVAPSGVVTYDYLIKDCTFTMDAGIYALSLVGPREGHVKGCLFDGGNGIYLQSATSPFINGCIFKGPSTGALDTSRGIFYDGDGLGTSAGLTLTDSEIMGYGTGLEIDYADWFSIKGCVIDYNVNSIVLKSQDAGQIIGNYIGSGSFTANPAIKLTSGTSGYSPDYCLNIKIIGNHIVGHWETNNTYDTIRIESSSTNIDISNNDITFWTRYGISYDDTCSYVIISNNKIDPRSTFGVACINNTGTAGDSTFLIHNNYFNASFPPTNTVYPFYRENLGYGTRYGGVQITDGSTSWTVTHYLGVTPTIVSLTASANHPVWVTNITSTTFDANTDASYAAFSIYWTAEKPQ